MRWSNGNRKGQTAQRRFDIRARQRYRQRRVFVSRSRLRVSRRRVVDWVDSNRCRLCRSAKGSRAAHYRCISGVAVSADRPIPRPERQPRIHRAIEVGIRQEAHASRGVCCQQSRVERVRSAERRPVRTVVKRELPGPISIVNSDDGQARKRACINVGYPNAAGAGNNRGDQRAGVTRNGDVLVNGTQAHVAGVVQNRRIVDGINRDRDGRDVGVRGTVVDLESETVRPVIVRRRGIGKIGRRGGPK